jgi:hypothetical protein
MEVGQGPNWGCSAKEKRTIAKNRDVLVTAVSDLGLDDRSSVPGKGIQFSLRQCVQTGSRARPPCCPMDTEGKAVGGVN